jgi:hypothetical protein
MNGHWPKQCINGVSIFMKSVVKPLNLVVAIALAVMLTFAITPKPANAFVLFGIHLFEKAKPTPTPTPIPTPTPTSTPKPSVSPTATVIAPDGNLPTTGPEESVGTVLLAVIGSLIALKLVRTA